jgi:trans-aconitate methyltransferase
MTQQHQHEPGEHHDWHADTYVDEWIARDSTRDKQRRPLLQRMLALAPFPPDAALRVLDVGAGYGLVTEEVLRAFPAAHVTVQDYSAPMIERAHRRLAAAGDKVSFAQCDVRDAAWGEQVGGPFDLVVSAIALHNLFDMEAIANSYRTICGLLAPGGVFLDCDHFDRVGGTQANVDALKAAGFETVECAWEDGHNAIVKATKSG